MSIPFLYRVKYNPHKNNKQYNFSIKEYVAMYLSMHRYVYYALQQVHATYIATSLGTVINQLHKYDYAFLIGVADLYFYRL